MDSKCTLDPMGSGVHSDDLFEVHMGRPDGPALVCGYHYTYWPELVAQA